ncbi:NlpC/P60 family protein [Candidatus Parcubacteria bacterium]|nr:NlpC/P60 family protein [Candidatus Parcubacteria bacterium]
MPSVLNRDACERLAQLRICSVLEPWLADALPRVPHLGRRVLVPACDVEAFFTDLPQHGGAILKTAVRITAVRLARLKINGKYEPKALPDYAPKIYSCSTFIAKVFAFVGIHLPRYAIDQSYFGRQIRRPGQPGLAFYRNTFPIADADRVIGHVGLTTRDGTIIHGSRAQGHIVEEALPDDAVLFTDPFPKSPQRLLIIPPKIQGVETALDVARWLARPLS